jgi:hypothetical protein
MSRRFFFLFALLFTLYFVSHFFLFFSFNILLNHPSEFEGGGTYFDHPLNYTRQIEQGSVLVHSGRRRHAGVEITAGIRFLLVGFIDEHRSTTDSKHLELHFQDHS